MPMTDIDRMLQDADLPTLLPALAELTGNFDLLRTQYRPNPMPTLTGLAPQGGLSVQAQQDARREAAAEIRRWIADGCPDPVKLAQSEQFELIRFITGDLEEESLLMCQMQLGQIDPQFIPVDALKRAQVNQPLRVVIIGAGMSGIAAARYLELVGIDVVILERHGDVGGVWLENQYPGCRLDTSNFSYSYSFLQNAGWSERYSSREPVWSYLSGAADALNVRHRIHFHQRVTDVAFDEDAATWTLTAEDDRDGGRTTYCADLVISAVGQLNTPAVPEIPGRDEFAGDAWHTAEWNHEVPLEGRSVAVIGTGASAFQVVPEIAATAGQLTVLQRTPPWILPTPDYRQELPQGFRELLSLIPTYHGWYRFFQFWSNVEGRRPFAVVDPKWSRPDSVSEKNHDLRRALAGYLEGELSTRPDLLTKSTPHYPPYAKRMLRDDGRWTQTLLRDNVALETEPIQRIEPDGIRLRDGRMIQADVIIYGTGFSASEFLSTMTITGRGGVELHQYWDGEPRAYLGASVPGFPNFFMLYGPNTNLVVNGSIVMFSEFEVIHVLQCIATLVASGSATIECRADALERYYLEIDSANHCMAYGVPGVRSWYKSSSGRVSQNWPLSSLDFWTRARATDDNVYELRGLGRWHAPAEVASGAGS